MMFRRLMILGLGAAVLTACNNADDTTEDEVAAPPPVLTPAPTPTAAPDGTALVAGGWTVGEHAQGARAVYGEEGGAPKLTISCDRLSGVVTMDMASSAGAPEPWRLDAGGEAARIDMAPGGAGLVAEIEPSLAIFHAFSVPGNVIVLTSPAGEPMQYGTHPGITRVLEACT